MGECAASMLDHKLETEATEVRQLEVTNATHQGLALFDRRRGRALLRLGVSRPEHVCPRFR